MSGEIFVQCFCQHTNWIKMVGNNNANGKIKCPVCGRNITVHFRREPNGK